MTHPAPLRAQVDPARFGAYRGWGELRVTLDALEARGARRLLVGASVEGAPLEAFEVGPADADRATVILAGIHAMEWIGVEVGLALLERLVADPPADRLVRVHPLVNVDGYRRVEGHLRHGRRRFDRTNAHGVDLNRNWPTHWKKGNRRAKVLPFLGDGGVSPLSEPEVERVERALLVLSERMHVERALSLHSFGRKVLYPYGGRWRQVGDLHRHRAAAEAIADALPGYEAVQSSRWVPGAFAPGMEIDHLHDAFGALALLVECSGGGTRLRDPGSWLHPFRWFNPPDPEHVAARLAPVLEGFVRGALP
ncbi:MAG TPA: M14 family metallopeptidase [Polyangiaceae bacterium LLY-WYZ-15_(1-7)]|nr:hypothetical protein [Myxococcales bacterium]MBJ74159.1 hypothetical protein [Sandaracinus sp.]HJK92924.1 M14 family metallopeptidase [Polyangiaceae bacterium LLY-WYZ-15_(1-7)]HJL02667.1 M14 family metallopeptidase [Polyangiaceae bacterium LLY-WYZ-15_(1-7)]HJL12649.1 M14 family metallopeptidase [Polyangiaceae bacterium LLY-WYZ-15_(1-7)]